MNYDISQTDFDLAGFGNLWNGLNRYDTRPLFEGCLLFFLGFKMILQGVPIGHPLEVVLKISLQIYYDSTPRGSMYGIFTYIDP